ncbi:tRNA preQ1(34) S-adenosylmethionine ribosyltransferase-isomerase QueA [Chloroflexota bacterium]
MKTSDFDYLLPPELIAQTPIEPRDHSRLMVLNCSDSLLKHRKFFEIIDYLRAGDVMVFNDSRVIPARLMGTRIDGGSAVEILLLRRISPSIWETLVKPGKRVKIGSRIEIGERLVNGDERGFSVTAEAIGLGENGTRLLRFSDETLLPQLGKIPLPPYIRVPLHNPERYQTIYADEDGSVAAPTAGLHFTSELIGKIKDKGIHCLFVTLHVGLDTFRPVRGNDPLEHPIHREYGVLSKEAASELNRAKAEGRRVICVGTTTVRLVEAAAQITSPAQIRPFEGWVSLFIVPGYQFRVVDALVTNFHLPRSTLLMLVTAFTGRGLIKAAYREAIAQQYRFYSFGDAMLIL